MAYNVADWGIKTPKLRYDNRAGANLDINSKLDNKPIRLNSRDYAQASGSSIGVQCKPNQNVTTTGDVIGAEFSPRVTDAGSGAIIALRADPVVKTATAARTVSAIRGLEVNPSLPGSGSAYTVTNDVTALRTFLDMGAGHTVSGKKSVILVATPNTSGWDYLLDLEASAGLFDATNGTYSTADGFIKIRVPEGDARIPYFLGVD